MKLLDWGVLAYWALDHPKYGSKATKLLKHVELSERALVTSLDLFILDVSLRQSDVEGYAFARILSEVERLRNLEIAAVDGSILAKGAHAAARFEVPLEIGVGWAAAQAREADGVYSFNADYDRTDLTRRTAP